MARMWSAILGLALLAGLACGVAVPSSPIKVTLNKRPLDMEQIERTSKAVQENFLRSKLLGQGEEDIPLLDFLDAQCKCLAGKSCALGATYYFPDSNSSVSGLTGFLRGVLLQRQSLVTLHAP